MIARDGVGSRPSAVIARGTPSSGDRHRIAVEVAAQITADSAILVPL